jgi:hypothetical protein
MSANSFLREIDQLKSVSTNLEALADHHPSVEEALISISGNIRSSAVMLEVLVATRIANRPE